HDVLRGASLAAAPGDALGDRGAQLGEADDRRVAGVAPAQRVDRRLDHRRRRHLVGIADGEQDDVPPLRALPRGIEMDAPRLGARAGDPPDQRREPHALLAHARGIPWRRGRIKFARRRSLRGAHARRGNLPQARARCLREIARCARNDDPGWARAVRHLRLSCAAKAMAERRMSRWRIGAVTVTRIVELEMAGGTRFILPQAEPERVLPIDWLRPNFIDESGRLRMAIQALVVETPNRRIIVDTCLGNDKQDRRVPRWNNLHGPFLADLAAAGYPRQSIDTVLCTHLHVDHVGWNTMLVDGRWVPTFPKARYLMGRIEFEYWRTQRAHDHHHPIFAD